MFLTPHILSLFEKVFPFFYRRYPLIILPIQQAGNTAKLYPVPGLSHLATWEDPEIRAVWEKELSGAFTYPG